jgi:glycerophosphoryl diester phosphodiesterase
VRYRWLVLIGAPVVALVVCLALALLARPAAEHPYFSQFERRLLVMAHRGGKGLWPENTLYAFERAVAMGVDVLEMDIHSTSDGVLVVMHDDTVDRTTDGEGPVHSFTLQALQSLDAGHDWSPDNGQTFPYRGQGITVPALEKVFLAFPEMPMNIEIKQAEPSIALPLCQMIRGSGLINRVLVASFHERAMREFRSACPDVATTAYENEVLTLFVLGKVYLGQLFSASAEAVQVPELRSGFRVLTPRFVNAAHNRNQMVHAWTINDKEDMRRMLALGVDGIITDYPDRLLELLSP